jgi:putative tricarboxylic transport membrane protein
MRRRNVIAAIVLIALSVGYGVLTAYLPERSLPNTPGPPFFPWINTVILMTLSLALLASGLFGGDARVATTDRGARLRGAAVLGSFFGYLLVLPGLGFVLATIPFFALMMALFGERRPLPVAAGAIGITLVLYILFRYGFSVFLPSGLLGGLGL